MKRLFIATLLALTTFTVWAQQPVLATQGDTINYYIGLINGLQMGQMIQGQKEIMPGIPSQYDIVKQGFINGLNGDSTLSIDDLSAYLQTTFEALQARQAEEANAREKEFLAKNGKRKGVVTTASGLQYEVLKKVKDKKAPRPAATDTVKVHYEGKLLDGTVFDSSYERGEPIEFPLTGVIKGWTEGLQLMPVGSKYRFYIPYSLAYGERGMGESIPPYSTLIFIVELLEVK
jgi:FKBP-type peptidyl-prolyl cis-trans isomerase